MKILIVTQYFWPENFRINDLALELEKQGHHITVLTGNPNYPQGKFYKGYKFPWLKKEKYNNIDIVRVPVIPRGNASSWRLFLNYISYAFFACIFAPFMCRGQYDIVFCYQPSPATVGFPAVLMKKIKKAPLFFWVQDSWPETLSAINAIQSQRLINLVRKLVTWIYKRCDKILVSSQGFIPLVKSHGILEEKIHYFPNWAETFYQPKPRTHSFFPDAFVILFAGNHGDAQGLNSVIDAAELLIKAGYHDIHWVLMGDGRCKTLLQSEVLNRNLIKTVHFKDPAPSNEMSDYFAAADCLLLSLANKLIFAMTVPSKLQSYMACAKPIIAAVNGETAEIIEKANAGFTSPAEQSQALADAVIKLYHLSDDEKQKLAQNSYQYYQQYFSRDSLFKQLLIHFEKALQ